MRGIVAALKTALRYVRANPRRSALIGTLFIFAFFVGKIFLFPSETPAPEEKRSRGVTVASVAELSSEGSRFAVVGTVRSENEASLRTEKSGQVTAVYKRLGDTVRAGDIIAEIDSKSERAALLSAQGAYDAARANVNKVKGGARTEQRSILEANAANAREAVQNGRASAVSTALSAYATVDSAIRGTADSMISNPDSRPQFTVPTTNSQLPINIENTRTALSLMLTAHQARVQTLTVQSDLIAELRAAEADVRRVRDFMDTIIQALNSGIAAQGVTSATIATNLANANASRTALTGALTSLSGARDLIEARTAALVLAEKSLEQGVSGGDVYDIALAEASVTQAQGSLAAARAAYERSVVRTPISGTLNALAITRGDFVQAFSPAATIANNGELEIVTYVTEAESGALAPGMKVALEGGLSGSISRIAPAVDPLTKKIEVRISLPKSTKNLTNGANVTVEIERGTSRTAASATRTTIPITALKVGNDTYTVFTVSNDSVLLPHAVSVGTLLGDRIVITSGLTPDMRIVVDARGLKAGDPVAVR